MSSKILTKTDFLTYCVCPKDFWLRKNRPDIYKAPEMTLFFQKLIKDGYEVERYAKKLFSDAEFQKQIKTEEGFYAELDIMTRSKGKGTREKFDIYEVKSSSEIKTDLEHNHIKDITFQTLVAEKSGINVDKSFIIHINKDYVKHGEINPFELLKIEDVTDRVNAEKEQVWLMMKEALNLMNTPNVSINGCDCIYKSAGQWCDSFYVLNPNYPEYSVNHIFIGNKLKELVHQEIFDPTDVPENFKMTDIQKDKVYLQKTQKPLIDADSIKNIINNLIYPIYFLDYESLNKPVPVIDGYKTNQQLIFQYSLHKLHQDGQIKHFEYLADDMENSTSGLVKSLRENIGPIGSVIVWHETFEKERNKELGELHPETKEFFRDLNSRIYDLKKVFQKDYLDPKFKGSASIKKVLPVLLPELSYKSLSIQDGTMAMSKWEEMINSSDSELKSEIRTNLLKYCELDTYAMLAIFNFLKNLIS